MVNILLTGLPGSGKTTLINKIRKRLNLQAIGFVTNEVRDQGRRIGFNIETISGIKLPLASKFNHSSRYRVASYGVYLENLNTIVEQLEKELQETNHDIVVIDEIGKMELFSTKFVHFLDYCLDSQQVLGTIMLKDNAYTKNIKQRSDTEVFHLNEENRDSVERVIMELLD